METDNLKYTRHLFKIVPNDYKYSLYELQLLLNGNHALPGIVRIEENRKYNEGTGFDEILIVKDQPQWNKCKQTTGMRPTSKENCFYGDLRQMAPNGETFKSLLIVQYDENKETLVIDYFKNFYPYNNTVRSQIINNHKYYFDYVQGPEV